MKERLKSLPYASSEISQYQSMKQDSFWRRKIHSSDLFDAGGLSRVKASLTGVCVTTVWPKKKTGVV